MNSLKVLDRKIAELEQRISNRAKQHIKILDNYEFELYDEHGSVIRHYKPCPTALKYHQSDKFVRLLMGPFGSGKSTASIAEIIFRACAMPKCVDGVRRCKVALMRNTSGQLETSTYKTWLTWFESLGNLQMRKKPILSMEHTFNDGGGLVQLELVYLACDRPDDFNKLKSTEFTIIYLNETNELPTGILDFVKGRVNGRSPSKVICPEPYWSGIIMDTNPPDNEHWIYKVFEEKSLPNYQIFKQPSGLLQDDKGNYLYNPDADNMENLKPNYYLEMAEGADEQFIRVYCLGEYGLVKRGEPVYPQYNDDLHSIDTIDFYDNFPLYIGIDFGLTPAAIICQYVHGVLYVIKEFVSKFNTSMEELVQNELKPYLDQFCRGKTIHAFHDPADPRGQANFVSPSQILHKYGIPSQPAYTNSPDARWGAVKSFLNRLTSGMPSLVISRQGCPFLRKGFYGNYHFRKVKKYGEDGFKEEADKNHPYSDIHDGLQYVALALCNENARKQVDYSGMVRRVRSEVNAW